MGDAAGLGVWNQLLAAALKMPGARVDRASFLKSALASQCSAIQLEQAIQTTPAMAGLAPETIRSAARSSLKWHRVRVAAVSAVAGLPGGWWMVGTIPADLAQYSWHVVVALQKLAYLYGWPSLFDDDTGVDDEAKRVLTMLVGVMLGAGGDAEGPGRLATAGAADVAKPFPPALTRYAVYRGAKEVAKWAGIIMTKKRFAERVGRSIPVAGGAVAGSITWLAFGKGSRRLLRHLDRMRPGERHA